MSLRLKSILYLSLLLASGCLLYADDCCQTNVCCNSICKSCNGPCTGRCGACFECPDDTCFNCGNSSCNGDCLNNSCNSTCCNSQVRTHIHPRSVGANTARELVGWQWELNRPFMCENYGSVYLAYEYQQTFRSERIANQLFGGTTLRFSGSKVANRNSCELLADNFGLSQNFVGSISFAPKIRNHIVDIGYYQGLDCWVQGAYFRLHAPIAYTNWQLNCCECVQTTSPVFDACYMDSSAVGNSFSISRPVGAIQSIQDALLGCTTFGDMKTPWCAGKIACCCAPGKVRLADIDLILGYNFCNTDCSHLGLYLQAVLPTGNKPSSCYLFSPVVGNGGHFEIGGGISAHTVIWGCETQNLALFFEGNITSMIKNRQCRVFDFCGNGPFSRYMLLKEYTNNGVGYFYNGNLVSGTCLSTQLVNVRVNVKGDASLKLAWRSCNWGFDLGYNIYGHSHEIIERIKDADTVCCNQSPFRYAPKGDTGVCCSCYPIIETADEAGTLRLLPDNSFVGLGASALTGCPTLLDNVTSVTTIRNNAAQPDATACRPGSSNSAQVLDVTSDQTFTPGPNQVCNFCLNYDSPAVTDPSGEVIGTLRPLTSVVEASNTLVNEGFILCNNVTPTKFLTADDIDLHSAEAVSTLTQKIFGHLSYTWYDSCGWNPNIGVGGEVEFDGQGRCSNSNTKQSRCLPTNIYQWGVWVKGGISF